MDTEKVPQDQLEAQLPEYDVIVVRSATKVRKELIDKCPKLKIIARGGVGLDNIDHDYARSKGLAVINTPAASSQAVAELVFAHLLGLARSLHQANRAMPGKGDTEFKSLKKSYSKGFQLRGRTMGIIGFGRIGQETARIALGMGMKVLAVDPMIERAELQLDIDGINGDAPKVSLPTVPMDDMLAQADIISLHIPFLGAPVLADEQFGKMKDGVILINCARGGTVDEDALLRAMESGKVAAAGLDVFENEPTPRKDLLDNPAISLSPHIGASTGEAQRNIGLELGEKITAHLQSNG
ncbi:MAG: D-2-hydroxyacid dehydrogenase [Bacteroidota bacterium]